MQFSTRVTSRNFPIMLFGICCLFSPVSASSNGDLPEFIGSDEQYKLLSDLKSVDVIIATSKEYRSKIDIVREQFRTIMKDKLETAGVKVDENSPVVLRLTVIPITDEDTGALTGNIRLGLELREEASLIRNANRSFFTTTWHADNDLTLDRLSNPAGKRYIEMQTTKFVADYHRAQHK